VEGGGRDEKCKRANRRGNKATWLLRKEKSCQKILTPKEMQGAPTRQYVWGEAEVLAKKEQRKESRVLQ